MTFKYEVLAWSLVHISKHSVNAQPFSITSWVCEGLGT